MKHGLYYSNGNFIVAVTSEDDWYDAYQEATQLVFYYRDDLIWSIDKNIYNRREILDLNFRLTR